MESFASGVKTVVARLVTGIVSGVFHPNVLMVLAFAAAVYAAYLTWGLRGALWSFAVLAFLLAMANATPSRG